MNETPPTASGASHLRPVTSESPNDDDMSIGQLTDRTPVGDPRGSFRFPEPYGFDGSVGDFLEFFVLEEIDDALLERVRRGYADAFRRHAERNDAHGGFPHEHTEDCEERIDALVDSTVPDASEATGEAHNCWLAGRSIDPLHVRSLVRSLQIFRCIDMLPEVHDQLWVEQFKVHGDELGARQNWEKYHAAEWFDEAMF